MKQITQRLDWIDWAKAIAIYLVVFGHMFTPFMGYIFTFHMPFFFLISGYLQKRRDPKTEWINSLKCLLVPYVIYNVYLLIYSYFTGEADANYPLNMLLGNQWYLSMACRPLWFLLALFLIRTIHSVLSERWAMIVAIACACACWVCNGTAVMNPEINYFQVWCAAICYPFFEMGVVLKRWKGLDLLSPVPGYLRYPLLLLTFAGGLYLTTLNGGVNIFRCHPGDNALLFYFNGLLISVSLLAFIRCTLDRPNAYVRLISEGTLLIFAVHQSILWPLHTVLAIHWSLILIVALATIVVLSAGIWLAKKYCPVLIGKWK